MSGDRRTHFLARLIVRLVAAGLVVPPASLAASANDTPSVTLAVDIYSPPWEFLDGKELTGFSVDAAKMAFTLAAVPFEFKIMPWNRAYNMARANSGVCVMSAIRTDEREPLFTWVGPLAHERWVVFALADSKVKVETLDDLKTRKIGAYRGDAVTSYLEAHGVPVEEISSDQADAINILKLRNGRLDFWAAGDYEIAYMTAATGSKEFKQVLTLNDNVADYIACNRNLPADIVSKLNDAFRTMATNGTLAQLTHKYGIRAQPEAPK